MSRLKWGEGSRLFDRGVDQGVLYLDDTAYPWNGLAAVNEKPAGYVDTEHYFDGQRLHITQETGDFEATISAYTYPDAFAEYNGYSDREVYKRFGFSYRTEYGDGHRLHLAYNVLVRNDELSWKTLSERSDPSLFHWDIYGTPVPVPGASPSARLMMEEPRDPGILRAIEDILYGSDTTEPRLPDPPELLELYEAATLLRVTYHYDGTYTVTGPDSMVRLLADGVFEVEAPTAFFLSHDIFVISSH